MFELSNRSKRNLHTAHKDLKSIVYELIKEMPVEVIEGYRNAEKQNQAYSRGKTQLMYPRSKHNRLPAEAIDLAPLPINFNNIEAYEDMVKRIQAIACKLGINIRLGAHFSFRDYGHVELN